MLDCPPLTIGADASVIAGWVDGVILVVDLQSSTYESVRDAMRQLESVHASTCSGSCSTATAAPSRARTTTTPR